MNTLVAFATQWGSKYGGINSFNADFLSAFGFAYPQSVRVICVVSSYDKRAIDETSQANVTLVSLPSAAAAKTLNSEHGLEAVEQLSRLQIAYDPDKTIWLGHDRITGEAAVQAAQISGGRSAVIHHMSYDHYESYAENSESAYLKTQKQKKIFADADLILAVGPLLRDAATDLIHGSKAVCMLIPGLAQIDVHAAPSTFVAFLSGRISSDAVRIKQGQLGIAAFATAERDAINNGMPDALCRQPKLLIRGVDFENEIEPASLPTDPEQDLKRFAEEYGKKVINLHALPYTKDREQLFAELAGASVALMPSWHEGFGLVAWEAIAAGVPLLLSKNSGVYRLIEDQEPGAEVGYVYALEIRGKADAPYFRPEDLTETVLALNEVAKNPGRARLKASRLRNLLGDYTWVSCADQAATCFGWTLERGFLPSAPATISSPDQQWVESVDVREESLSPLKIPTPQWRRDAGRAESQLLRAEEALLPFDRAREPEVDKLNDWLDGTQLFQSLRLITGEGGQGKTRLALELCKRRTELGWTSGFLDSTIPANDIAISWQALRALDSSLLVIIDYAETRQSVVLALIQEVLLNPSTKPVRILLLARDGGEWWDNLPGQNPNCEGFLTGPATGSFRLTSLYATNPDRQLAFSTALNAFATALNVEIPDVHVELAGEHFERPLYIQMAALLALHGERPITAEAVTKALLNHERRYWRALLAHFRWSEPERKAEQLLALATLAGGFLISRDAKKLWEDGSEFDISSSDFNSLFRELASLYPGTQGLEGLRPDLLGEALVAQAVLRPEGEALLDVVVADSATQMVRRNALTVIARLSTYRMDLDETIVEMLVRKSGQSWKDLLAVSTETVSRLPELSEQAFVRLSSNSKGNVAGLLHTELRDESVQFAKLSSLVFGYLAEKFGHRFEQKVNDPRRMADYANHLLLYARALSGIGQLEQADEIGQKSVDLFRRLAARNRDRFDLSLSDALDSHAEYLWKLRRTDEALNQVKEALDIIKRFAQVDPGQFEQQYGAALENYATSLGAVGRHDEAVLYEKEGLEIIERLHRRNTDLFEADYGTSLHNYAFNLTQVGKYEEALKYGGQALDIRKRLSQKNADRFEPVYAHSLHNYADILARLGEAEEAVHYVRQALEIYGRLSEKNADRFEPDYLLSLNAYAGQLQRLGRDEESLRYSQESLEITKRLRQKNADRFESAYASSLSTYAIGLSYVGRYAEALEYFSRAAEVLEPLTQKNAQRFGTTYAMSLQNYAGHLIEAGRNEEALQYQQQSHEILKQLVDENPDRFKPGYANSFSDFANILSSIGRYEQSLEYDRQAIEICEGLIRKNADQFEPLLADFLRTYAVHLNDVGTTEESLKFGQQALELYRRLFQQTPRRYAEEFFTTGCFTRFVSWLSDAPAEKDDGEFLKLLSNIPTHKHPLMLLFLKFVEGCQTSVITLQLEAMQMVNSHWKNLSVRQKLAAEPYWLCAVACSAQSNVEIMKAEWRLTWDRYSKQRNGRLETWMLHVAHRLRFDWPEQS